MSLREEIEWYPLPEVKEATASAPPSVDMGDGGRGHVPSSLQSSSDSRLLKTDDSTLGTPGLLGLHSESITAHDHSTPSVTVVPTSGKHTPPSLPPPPVTSSHPHTITHTTPPGNLTITSLLSSGGWSAGHPNHSTSGNAPGGHRVSYASISGHSSIPPSLTSSHESLPGYRSYHPSYQSAQLHTSSPSLSQPHIPTLHSHTSLRSHSTPSLPPTLLPVAKPSHLLSSLDQLWQQFLNSALATKSDSSVTDGREVSVRKEVPYSIHRYTTGKRGPLPALHLQPPSTGKPVCTCHKPPMKLTPKCLDGEGIQPYGPEVGGTVPVGSERRGKFTPPETLFLHHETMATHWLQGLPSAFQPVTRQRSSTPPPPSAAGHPTFMGKGSAPPPSSTRHLSCTDGGERGRDVSVQTSSPVTQCGQCSWATAPSHPPTLTALTLQEALRAFRPGFIVESERRQRRVQQAAVRRKREREGNRPSPVGAREQTGTDREGERVQRFVCLAPGRHRPKMTKREMYDQSKRYWGRLSEVKKHVAERKHREESATNRLRVQLYQKEDLARRNRIARRK